MLVFLTDGSDFVGISGRQLTFSPTVNSSMVPVSIINDDVLEDMVENFTASLSSDVPRLVLSPDLATVDIMDDDCKQTAN